MRLVISIDVEEEGLFSGQYSRTPAGVTNVAQLRRLEFIPQEFGFPLTLLVTHQVAQDPAARQVLIYWRDHYQAEIGAHLHPWSTPPFQAMPDPEPVPSERMPLPLLRSKFETLITSLKNNFQISPRSFRMGRFDGGRQILARLPEFGLQVDSSMVPLYQKIGGPDNFLIPSDPFYLRPRGPEGPEILEVPLTLVPIWAGAPGLIYRLSQIIPRTGGEKLRLGFRYLGAVGIQPVWFPLVSMRWAVRLHRRRGGQVLTMFFHSSQLKPGATPQFSSEAAVNRLIRKLHRFLTWLVQTGPVKGVTLSELYREAGFLREGRAEAIDPGGRATVLYGSGGYSV